MDSWDLNYIQEQLEKDGGKLVVTSYSFNSWCDEPMEVVITARVYHPPVEKTYAEGDRHVAEEDYTEMFQCDMFDDAMKVLEGNNG